MSLQFYMDHNVHGAIVAGLRERGVNCLAAQEDGKSNASDERILERARELHRVVFTQDVDFLEITATWQTSGIPFAGVIYSAKWESPLARQSSISNCSRGFLNHRRWKIDSSTFHFDQSPV